MQENLTITPYQNPVVDDDFPDPVIIDVDGQGYYAYATHDEFSPTINNIFFSALPGSGALVTGSAQHFYHR